MRRNLRVGIFPSIIILIAVVLVMGLFIIKGLWSWIVPDLFPEAAGGGLVTESISWFTSFKIALALALFTGFGSVFSKRRKYGYVPG